MLFSGFVSLMFRDLVLTNFHPERTASLCQETDAKACAHTENAFKLCAENSLFLAYPAAGEYTS